MSRIRTPRMAVSAMFFLNGGLFGIWASRIPTIKDTLELSHGQLGLCLLCMSLGAMIAFPITGHHSDHRGASEVTKITCLAYLVSLCLLPLAWNMPSLMAVIFLFGATHGGMDVAMNAWGAEVERKMGRPIMSSFHAMFSLGAFTGAASGYLALAIPLSPEVHFPLAAAVIALACLPFATAPWEDHAGQSTDGPTFAFPKGILALVGLVAFCSSIGEGAMADWSAVYITGATQASEQSAALGYAAFSVAMVTVRFLGDRAIHAFGPVKAARISGLFAATGATLVVTVPTLGTILLGFALMGVGYAVIVPLAFSRAANDPHLSQGRAIASVATLGYGGTLLGPAIIGGIAEVSSLQMSFSLLAVLALVMVALARVMRPA